MGLPECNRCEKIIGSSETVYWNGDDPYCGNCYSILEAHAEAAWEAQKEEQLTN